MTVEGDQERIDIHGNNLAPAYKRHVQGGIVRSVASVVMWCSAWLAYIVGVIKTEHIIGVSYSVLFLILFNPPTLWILKRISNRRLFESFSLFINLLEIIGYTSIMHFLGGIEAGYLLPIYAAIIIYVGVVAPRRYPFYIAGFCAVCFSVMVTLEGYGILQTHKFYSTVEWPPRDQTIITLVTISLLFVVAFISFYTADLLKKNRDRLRRQNEELRLALQKASESDRLKSEFMANMSHELRTPLNAIIGFSELLESQYPEKLDESQKEFSHNINASGKHLLSIINDILDLSKIEAGKLETAPADVPVLRLLENGMAMFRENAHKHRIRLSIEVEEGLETIKADELRLRQIIYNLLSNAIKFTPAGGTVTLSARQMKWADHQWLTNKGEVVSLPAPVGHEGIDSGRVVDISVTDTGIGVKKEERERIFKPFEQADGSISRRYQGTGLGLSLAKRFAELHGGYLCVESEGENRGSTFHCVIPG